MKKLILFAAILFAGISVVNAQSGEAPVDKITLKVELKPIQTLVIKHEDKAAGVNLVYSTVSDYENGVTQDKPGHLKVYSTGGFQVDVMASEFSSSDNTKVMKPITINVQASNSSLSKTPKMPIVKLETSDKALIKSTVGGFNKDFDVKYVGGTNYRDLYKNDKSNIFTTTVTYTIVAI